MTGSAAGLAELGWDDRWQIEYAEVRDSGEPARVTSQERDRWIVRTASSECIARIPSRAHDLDPPVVGDWVVVAAGPAPSDPLSIVALLPRRSAFVRGTAGGGNREQVLAANIDLVWIVHGLDTPPNLRRLERYLTVAWQSGGSPSILLTKVDLAEDVDSAVAGVEGIAMGVPVRWVSARDSDSVHRIRDLLSPGRTVVLLGPSGAGKSTLINLMSGTTVASTGEVRAGDRKGRHTTTRRQLFEIEGGGLVVDTPGLRELRLRDVDHGLDRAYADIDELAEGCRFSDCRHEMEPGCAVIEGVEAGDLPAERLDSYRKLRAEANYERRRSDPRARKAAVSEHKTALKTMRYHLKRREGG